MARTKAEMTQFDLRIGVLKKLCEMGYRDEESMKNLKAEDLIRMTGLTKEEEIAALEIKKNISKLYSFLAEGVEAKGAE